MIRMCTVHSTADVAWTFYFELHVIRSLRLRAANGNKPLKNQLVPVPRKLRFLLAPRPAAMSNLVTNLIRMCKEMEMLSVKLQPSVDEHNALRIRIYKMPHAKNTCFNNQSFQNLFHSTTDERIFCVAAATTFRSNFANFNLISRLSIYLNRYLYVTSRNRPKSKFCL